MRTPNNSKTYVLYLFLICLILPCCLLAQSKRKAGTALLSKEVIKSSTIYKHLINNRNDDISLWYQYAEASRHENDYKAAEKYYTKVLEDSENFRFIMSSFWLGQVKKNLGKYEEAIELFKGFSMMGIDDYYTNWAANEIPTCLWAANTQADDPNIQLWILDENINSNYSEIGAVEMGNRLYYSTSRYVYKEDKQVPKRHLNKMMVSKNLERGRPVLNDFIEEGKHFCHTTFSKDWQRMYFTICENVNSEKEICEIHYMDQDRKGRWKNKIQTLPNHINLPGYTATHPAIGYDSTTQKEILFFVSDRPNGKGKMDIWYSEVGKKGFSAPVNLTSLNTREDDVTPFFKSESQTLFFSSKGHLGFGGYDVFFTDKKGGDWKKAENAGLPINSGYDDLYFSKNTYGNRGYLSSNRPGTRYHNSMNEGCCLDIYSVFFKK